LRHNNRYLTRALARKVHRGFSPHVLLCGFEDVMGADRFPWLPQRLETTITESNSLYHFSLPR
ncbi:MAG: hypothetical protein WBB24_11480, partial [Maribacter sp.]